MSTRACTAVIADVDSAVRKNLGFMLSEIGIQVLARADSPENAVKLVREHRPGLVTLEIGMAGMFGVDLIGEILQQHPPCRILVFTLEDERIYAKRALEAGALGYLMKRADADEVRKALQTVARGNRYLSAGILEQTDTG